MATPASTPLQTSSSQLKLDQFLVCGLGSLGQHCVVALKEFGVSVIAIESEPPNNWEVPNLADLLDDLVVGDCRQLDILSQAKIEQCRAVLLVTSNERINAETALTVRQLNSQTRLVVRSAQENLNQLLSQHLGNYVAYQATQFPATAFTLAALGTEISGFFPLEEQWLRVVKRQILPDDPWCQRRRLWELNSRTRRLLKHTTSSSQQPNAFHDWKLDALLFPNDTLAYIEITNHHIFKPQQNTRKSHYHWWQLWQKQIKSLSWENLKQKLITFWLTSYRDRLRRVAIVCAVIIFLLLLLGTILFHWHSPEITLPQALHTTAILLLGGYADLFGGFPPAADIPWWLQLFSLGLTLAGTAFVGVLYALLTEALLSARFQFLQRRPPVPKKDHVVLVGLGRVGQRIAVLLQEFQQPVVGLTKKEVDSSILPNLPIITGDFTEGLKKANLPTAKSVVIATDDELLNLEVGLMANDTNPQAGLVIRTFEQRLSDNLKHMLPKAQVLCVYALTAKAFAGAAFGEQIRSLFQLYNQTILVTEYKIEAGDTLNGLLLSEVAYGYEVVPILHQKLNNNPQLMPSDDFRLAIGDRFVILATIDSLRRIEEGEICLKLRKWHVTVEKVLTQEARFEGANTISRISGCTLKEARQLMNNLPRMTPIPLYQQQAQRLVRELAKRQVTASLVEIVK
ncbi:MAG: NAD-binding protein [Coleofasciculaceae cyanobacterium]